jgi:hypothetical protein
VIFEYIKHAWPGRVRVLIEDTLNELLKFGLRKVLLKGVSPSAQAIFVGTRMSWLIAVET